MISEMISVLDKLTFPRAQLVFSNEAVVLYVHENQFVFDYLEPNLFTRSICPYGQTVPVTLVQDGVVFSDGSCYTVCR